MLLQSKGLSLAWSGLFFVKSSLPSECNEVRKWREIVVANRMVGRTVSLILKYFWSVNLKIVPRRSSISVSLLQTEIWTALLSYHILKIYLSPLVFLSDWSDLIEQTKKGEKTDKHTHVGYACFLCCFAWTDNIRKCLYHFSENFFPSREMSWTWGLSLACCANKL